MSVWPLILYFSFPNSVFPHCPLWTNGRIDVYQVTALKILSFNTWAVYFFPGSNICHWCKSTLWIYSLYTWTTQLIIYLRSFKYHHTYCTAIEPITLSYHTCWTCEDEWSVFFVELPRFNILVVECLETIADSLMSILIVDDF